MKLCSKEIDSMLCIAIILFVTKSESHGSEANFGYQQTGIA